MPSSPLTENAVPPAETPMSRLSGSATLNPRPYVSVLPQLHLNSDGALSAGAASWSAGGGAVWPAAAAGSPPIRNASSERGQAGRLARMSVRWDER